MSQDWFELRWIIMLSTDNWYLIPGVEPELRSTFYPQCKASLPHQGSRHKRACFTLMACAFLNNASCTKCKCLWMNEFFYILGLICVLQSSSAISDPTGRRGLVERCVTHLSLLICLLTFSHLLTCCIEMHGASFQSSLCFRVHT